MRELLRGFTAALLLMALIAAASYGCASVFAGSGAVQRNIVYKADGDWALEMDIYLPASAGEAAPVLVYAHGGGWYTGDKTTGAGQEDIPELVARGYAVAAINYRLAPKYKFPAQLEDLKCAICFLRTNAARYGIDAARIGIWGDSAGGHLAALVGVTGDWRCPGCDADICHADECCPVQAVASFYGPTDLAAVYEKDRSPHMEHVFGTADRLSPVISQASPLTHVSGDDPPFLLIHGEADEMIPVEQSRELYRRLTATLVIVENSGHGFVARGGNIRPSRDELTRQLADFFDTYLK